MKKLAALTAVILSILLTLVFAGGCLGQKIAEKVTEQAIENAIENQSGEDVEVDLGEGEVTIQGDDGEVTINSDEDSVEIKSDEGEATFGSGADLPDGFPEVVPIYDNMEITSSISGTNGDDKESFTVSAESNDSVDDINSWYESQLGGWEITGQFSMDSDDSSTASINAETDDYELSLMIVEDEDSTVIVMVVTEK